MIPSKDKHSEANSPTVEDVRAALHRLLDLLADAIAERIVYHATTTGSGRKRNDRHSRGRKQQESHPPSERGTTNE
jgi:hypothetical protein